MGQHDDLIRRGEVIESVRRIIQSGLPEEAIYDEINKIPTAFNKQRTINIIEEQIKIHKKSMDKCKSNRVNWHTLDGMVFAYGRAIEYIKDEEYE